MVNQRLFNYIKSELSRGVSPEKIIEELVAQGWDEEDVDNAINLAVKQRKSERLVNIAKTGGIVMGTASLIITVIFAIFIIILFSFLMFFGFPWYFGAIFILFALFLIVTEVVRIKRISSVKSEPQIEEGEINDEDWDDEIWDDEIIDYVAGIMRTMGSGTHSARGYEFLGAGKVITSENAMIFTDKRILFITAPVPGAETMVSGVDIPMWEWLLDKNGIESEVEEMVNSMTIEEIAASNPKNFWINYDEIARVKFGKHSQNIKIIKKDGKKLKYAIRDKDDFEKVKSLLSQYS